MSDPLPPLDDDGPSHRAKEDNSATYDTDTTRGTRGVGGGRHTTSVVLALLLVPAAYVLLDYATFHALRGTATFEIDGVMPVKVLATTGGAVGCLLLVAAAGRISALGPLLAGLVWGAAPTAWVLLDYTSYVERVRDIPDVYDEFGLGLLTSGFGIYPAVAGLLLGFVIAGKWRRPAAEL